MYLMLRHIGTNNEICMFNRIYNLDNCLEKKLNDVTIKSSPIHFFKSLDMNLPKTCITSLWRPMTQGQQFQKGLSQCGKQLFIENRFKIVASIWLEYCSQAEPDTHRHTSTSTQTMQWSITPPRFLGCVIIVLVLYWSCLKCVLINTICFTL